MRLNLAFCRTDSSALDILRYGDWFPPERYESLCRSVASVQRESVAGRMLLAALLRQREPEAVLPPRLNFGPWGKPVLTDYPELYFNLSHSGDWAVCAMSTVPVGVDLQENRHIMLSIARKFAPSEQTWLESVPEAERSAALCWLWSLKEAFCKCTGDGLSLPLDRAVFTMDPLSIQVPGYTVCTPPPPEADYALALCARTEEPLEVDVQLLEL